MTIRIPASILLFAFLVLLVTSRASAQIFTALYSFTNGTDGAGPQGGVTLSGSTLYGTAAGGGTNLSGTAFAIGAGGAGFSAFHTFTLDNTNPLSATYTNSNDGTDPLSLPIISGSTLYGTAYAGGTNDTGTVFAMGTGGAGFVALHTFSVITNYFTNSVSGNNTNTDGSYPCSALALSGNTFYGTTEYGGMYGNGTIFQVNTDGSGFTTLYSFSPTFTNAFGIYTNGDGANPVAGLIVGGGALYGTAQYGGTNGSGSAFSFIIYDSKLINIHNFGLLGSNSVPFNNYTNNVYTNSDGAYPAGGLIVSGITFYGTAQYGGANGRGTIFSMGAKGDGFTILHNFGAENYCAPIAKLTNSDGVCPQTTLALISNTLFGTTYAGGTNDCGTVFSINTSGAGFTTIYNFSQPGFNSTTSIYTNADGAYPNGSLALWSSNMLYGTTAGGGTSGCGTVFAIVYGPGAIPLNYLLSGQNLIVSWDDSALTLQSAPTVNGPWTTVPGATSPYTVGLTNPMQFFQVVTNGP